MKISGLIFKEALKRSTFTQEEAAEKLGLSRQTVSTYCRMAELSDEFIADVKTRLGIDLIGNHAHRQDLTTIYKEEKTDHKLIPYYDIEVSAGDINFYQDFGERPAFMIDIPIFNDCDLAMPVYGDSMYPKIKNGDIVLLKKIKDKSIISYGEIHLVVTAEQRLLKYVRKHPDKTMLKLLSENERYDEIEVERDKVLHLFIYKGKIEKSQI